MRIAILGPGRIGSALAHFLCGAGHEVLLSAFRDEEKAFRLADALGVLVGELREAREFAQVSFLAVPHGVAGQVLQAFDAPGGIIVDCTNQFGSAAPAGFSTTTELLASRCPRASMVKAFNTLRAQDLRRRGSPEREIAIPYCCDSGAAAAICETLIHDCGYAPLNLGPLSNGALMEPGGPFFLDVLTRDTALRMARAIESTAGYLPTTPT